MTTSDHRRSYWKWTTLSAVGAALSLVAAAAVLALSQSSVAAVAASLAIIAGLALAAFAASGLVILARDKRAEIGAPDLFLARNEARSESSVTARTSPPIGRFRRRIARMALGHDLVVGDEVRIRSLSEILETLDASQAIDGMPFMPEMAKYCGQVARVYRCVDKVYDYGFSKRMRRIDDTVLLLGLRCDGQGHGGCQAACYLIWKTAWLERMTPGANRTSAIDGADLSRPQATTGQAGMLDPRNSQTGDRFRCQLTEMGPASVELSPRDLRKEIKPLVAGNVTLSAFLVAWATRFYNFGQRRLSGARFPILPVVAKQTAAASVAIAVGDSIRVKSATDIARTLNERQRHRGLWFDSDMIKHCRQPYRTLLRVDRLIDVASGRLIEMKNPCFVLDGVDYSGEYQGFGSQHEYTYWRDVWLQPASADQTPPARTSEPV